jgi:hypothetical protein
MGEYKKITKYDVDFPAYCLFFIKRILANLNEADMDDETTMTLIINTPDHPYCYDAFELVVRTFERKGYQTRIPGFKREKIEGKPDTFQYKWTIKKIKNYDDLPF